MTGRRAVALLIGVDHHGAPARSSQHQRSTQTGRAAADDSAFPLTRHGLWFPVPMQPNFRARTELRSHGFLIRLADSRGLRDSYGGIAPGGRSRALNCVAHQGESISKGTTEAPGHVR
jgi:hypothetical protein